MTTGTTPHFIYNLCLTSEEQRFRFRNFSASEFLPLASINYRVKNVFFFDHSKLPHVLILFLNCYLLCRQCSLLLHLCLRSFNLTNVYDLFPYKDIWLRQITAYIFHPSSHLIISCSSLTAPPFDFASLRFWFISTFRYSCSPCFSARCCFFAYSEFWFFSLVWF